MSLFRPEVQEARKYSQFGAPIPVYASSTHWLVGILFVICSALAMWLATGRYTRTEQASGWVVPSGAMARIQPLRPGTLTRLDVREGQIVRKGQALGIIETSPATEDSTDPGADRLALVEEQRRLVAQQATLARSGTASEVGRNNAAIKELNVQIASTGQQLALQRDRVASAEKSSAILAEGAKRKYISQIDNENQRRTLLAERSELENLVNRLSMLRAQVSGARADQSRLTNELNNRLSTLGNTQLDLDQRKIDAEEARSYVLSAPIAGRVVALQAKVGEHVTGQTPLLIVMGNGSRLTIELYAPSRAIGFVKPGQEVRLMYDAFPYQQFGSQGGIVAEVTKTALPPTEVFAPIKVEEPVYRIRISPAQQMIRAFGQDQPIQPGMTLKANLVLERQSFLSWLMQPINAIRNRT